MSIRLARNLRGSSKVPGEVIEPVDDSAASVYIRRLGLRWALQVG